MGVCGYKVSYGLKEDTYLDVTRSFKGTAQRDFSPGMGSYQALYSVSEVFSNLSSNSKRNSRFLFTYRYCLERRVATPRIVYSGELQLSESFIVES